ncbi:high affinity immunoglobulin gamma Fc receptor I-like isoform X3 [Aquarana catesbeiana]|uniref:high affinity immunoglobulin gamma Fc receptor I-like isoform X3 n=1 Tax=Aquarana catesbeiana TaxID=8400 RepID=UPI003CC9D8C6
MLNHKTAMTGQSTALIVFISTILGHTGSAVTPVVTFTPNWRKIFTGESITMTCDVGSTGGKDLIYIWYKDGTWVHAGKIYTTRSANTWYNGDYSCQAGTERSGTARLEVVVVGVILQVPLDVHEGDDLTLKCHHRSDYTAKSTIFYKDEELFEIPEIKVTPSPVVEGDEMTLTCDTSLSPLRPRTQLKFAFYKDGQNVRESFSNNQYGIQSAQVKDSGKYSCEVTTSTNSVRKKSQEILVKINGEKDVDYTLQNLIRLLASGIIILIGSYIFYCHMKIVRVFKTSNVEDTEEMAEEHQLSSH